MESGNAKKGTGHMAHGAGRKAKRGKIKNGKISGFKGVAKSQRFGRLY
jgi:hypothetical protein